MENIEQNVANMQINTPPVATADQDNNNPPTTTQSTRVLLTGTPEVSHVGYKEKKELLCLGTIHAPEFEQEDRQTRAPIDLIAVIDKSGSMRGQKLDLVKEALKFMLEQLKPDDCLSLVTFDSEVKLEIPLAKLSADQRAHASDVVTRLKDGSSTNLSGGLFMGMEQVISRKKPNEIASVLLFTDGLANVGLQRTGDIVPALEKLLGKVTGACTVFTFGYGADHDPNLLKTIADSG